MRWRIVLVDESIYEVEYQNWFGKWKRPVWSFWMAPPPDFHFWRFHTLTGARTFIAKTTHNKRPGNRVFVE